MAKKKEKDVKLVLEDQIIANIQQLNQFSIVQQKIQRKASEVQAEIIALQGGNTQLINTLATLRNVKPEVIFEEIEKKINPEPKEPEGKPEEPEQP